MALMNPLQQYSARTLMVETTTTVLALAVVAVVVVVAAAAAPIVYRHIAVSIVVTWVTLRDTDGCVVTRMSIGTR